jgi:hypothetical protein
VGTRAAAHEGWRSGRGQGTVEWIALVLVVCLLALALLAVGVAMPGLTLVEGLGARLACLARLDRGACLGEGGGSALDSAYGAEVAYQVRAHAPRIEYEEGMRALPVDFRTCRDDACSLGAERGPVLRSATGEPVTLFVHAIDCRAGAADTARRSGYDCSGERTGNLYLQYWAYYPGSQSLRGVPGNPGFHRDDWESLQLRLSAGATLARASSHHGYNYTGGLASWLSDAGITKRAAWGADEGRYYVSGGSHAGHVHDDRAAEVRYTPGPGVRLVPIEALRGRRRWRFAVSPPWRKRVYRDPEYEATD